MGLVYDYIVQSGDGGNSLRVSFDLVVVNYGPGYRQHTGVQVNGDASLTGFHGTCTGCISIEELASFVSELDEVLKLHQGTAVLRIHRDMDPGFCYPSDDEYIEISFTTIDKFTVGIASEFFEWLALWDKVDNVQARLNFAFIVLAETLSDSLWDLKAIYQNLLEEGQAAS